MLCSSCSRHTTSSTERSQTAWCTQPACLHWRFHGPGKAGGQVDALIGGAVAFAGLALLRRLTRGGLGGGDLKMAGLVGLVVGYSNLPLAATVMVLAGGVSALALLAIGRLSRRGSMAYGPFIALGGLVALIK